MYLSDRDLKWAIECGKLIIDPPPEKIDSTSIDLRLDKISQAKVWDIARFNQDFAAAGHNPYELRIGQFEYEKFSPKYLVTPPAFSEGSEQRVFARGDQIIVKPGGFVLWQTKEWVGTPEEGADLICFVDGKSTRARTGILVHLTAPTIHASWSGRITLEIANLGPFHFVLEEDDVIAQLTVAKITSVPARNMKKAGSVTYQQSAVTAGAKGGNASVGGSTKRREK